MIVNWCKPNLGRVVVWTATLLLCGIAVSGFTLHAGVTSPLPMPPAVEMLVDGPTVTALGRIEDDAGQQTLPWVASGRHVPTADGKGLQHEWPGLAVEARFSGTSFLIHFDDAENRFRLLVDDAPIAVVTKPGLSTVHVEGLDDTEHHLRIEKLSESWKAAAILGLSVPADGEVLTPPTKPPRRIDIYGDSDSVGYGILGQSHVCQGDDVFLLSDSTKAWPSRLAAHYDAIANLTARSGIGLVRNYGGAHPGFAISDIRRAVLPSEGAGITDGTATPAWLTIIALGDNDFAEPLTAQEAWPDAAALQAAFTSALAELLRDVTATSPGRPIFVVAYADAGVPAHPLLESVVNDFAARGLPVRLVREPVLERSACDWHPSVADHAALTDRLVTAVDMMIADGLLEAK